MSNKAEVRAISSLNVRENAEKEIKVKNLRTLQEAHDHMNELILRREALEAKKQPKPG